MPIVEFSNLNKYGNLRTRRFWQEKSNLSINPKGFGPFIGFKLFKYDHESHIPPSLVTLSGQKYIIPTWQKVLLETRLEDINWIKPKVKHIKSKTIEKQNKSSSSDAIYSTKYYPDSGKYHCDCPGTWRTRGNCKHVKQMRNEIEG